VLVDIFFAGFEGELRDITVTCVRIIFPMTGILVLSAWTLGILNSHRKFFVSYVAPVAWNVAIIATLLLLGSTLEQRPLVIALAWGALIGGVLQFGVQVPFMLRLERQLNVGWRPRDPHVRTVLVNAGPAILGRGVVQVSGWVDMLLASFLFVGAVASLGYAQTLYILPVSLFGMSVAAAELPEMSREGGVDTEALRRRLEAGLRQIAVLVVPSAIGYLVVGDVVVAALYETGEFQSSDTLLVALVLGGYAVGLLASTATRLYSSAFYALRDTRTPAKIAALRVIVSAALGVSLMLVLERYAVRAGPITFAPTPPVPDGATLDAYGAWRPLGAAGLALGAGLAAWVEWRVLRRVLGRRIGGVGAGRAFMLRLAVAAVLAAAAGRLIAFLLPPLHPILVALLVLGPYAGVYFGAAHVLGVREAFSPIRSVFRRFHR
jgi:putative peptidoglycan lipid II flippase